MASWRKYQERKLGPYWRLIHRREGRQRAVYLGRFGTLVRQVRARLRRLQQYRDMRRTINRSVRETKASLRTVKQDLARRLRRWGLRLKGWEVRGWRSSPIRWAMNLTRPFRCLQLGPQPYFPTVTLPNLPEVFGTRHVSDSTYWGLLRKQMREKGNKPKSRMQKSNMVPWRAAWQAMSFAGSLLPSSATSSRITSSTPSSSLPVTLFADGARTVRMSARRELFLWRNTTMRLVPKLALLTMALMAWTETSQARYKETMDPNGLTKNLQSDYGLVDDHAKANQSSQLQEAINDIAAAGGGRLILPKGTYRFARVHLRSNVHLLIEKDTVIKPHWPRGKKAVVFLLDAEAPTDKREAREKERAYIENVSIRGLGGRFIVDYSDRERREGEGVRAVLCKMVKNFLISDLDVKDNFTVYCGVTMSPTRSKSGSVEDWEVSRATDGTMRNCRIFNASPGYGLVQLHGAQSVHFEDLYAKGGVALRLETGALGGHTAVFDISAKNIVCENGRCAVMLGPHSAMNGLVHVDGVTAKSCAYAVTIGLGGVKKQELARNPNAKDGRFADGSSIKNIHAVFGRNAQIKTHAILAIPEEYLDDLRPRRVPKFFDGPSIGAVKDATRGAYRVVIENVTLEGFKYNNDKKVLTPQDARPGKWAHALRKWRSDRGISDQTKDAQGSRK